MFLAHPPFNPIYFDAVRDSAYSEGLERVKQVTRELAAKYGLPIIGSFDPADLGCTSDLYIDAEHSNPTCLARIIDQYLELDRQGRQESAAGAQG